MSQLVRNAHDRFLKQAMTNLKVAQEFFEEYLPDDLKKVISFKNMEICKNSFIDKSLKLSEVDLLYKVDFNNVTGYIYILLEHQSTPDLKMPLRMYHYTVQSLERHIKNNPGFEYLPIIYPLVLYHHLKPYPHSNDIYHLFGPNEDLATMMSIHLSPKVGETVMSLGERLIEQGRNEGRSEGAQDMKKLITALLTQKNINTDVIEEIMQTNIDSAKEKECV